MKYVCIHGHFYQPPRENPYLEAIELQDSAYPYHDWNERITAECYAPNAASRIVDAENRIVKLVNNYAHISFNFGPTLLWWMKELAPSVHAAIVEADKTSRQHFSVLWVAGIRPFKQVERVAEMAAQLPHINFVVAGGPMRGYEAYYEEILARAERPGTAGEAGRAGTSGKSG